MLGYVAFIPQFVFVEPKHIFHRFIRSISQQLPDSFSWPYLIMLALPNRLALIIASWLIQSQHFPRVRVRFGLAWTD